MNHQEPSGTSESSKAAHSLRSGENASSNERLILLSILRFLRLFDEDGDGAANCC